MLKLDLKLDIEDIISGKNYNIANLIDKHKLGLIAAHVITTDNEDEQSRKQWADGVEKILEMTTLTRKPKNKPFRGASNIKYPLITTGLTKFVASMHKAIVIRGETVHMAIAGDDPDNSKHKTARVLQDHMNYKLLVESTEFERELDKLSTSVFLTGMGYKQTYYDPIEERVCSTSIPWDEFHIHKDERSLKKARRYSRVFPMHPNEIVQMVRYDIFREIDDKKIWVDMSTNDPKDCHEIIEQHTYLDLDGDGYEEPYIVTVLKSAQEVLRITPRYSADKIKYNAKGKIKKIIPTTYITDFHGLNNPDGSYYSIGFGQLLYDMNHTLNSLLNQMTDAGNLSTTVTGFVDGSTRMKGGDIEIQMGKIIKLNTALQSKVSDAVHLLQYPPPSPVMLQLFDTILAGAEKLLSVTDATSGNAQVQNVASNVMASQLQQGLEVWTDMERRFLRSLKEEFEKIYEFNSVFLSPQSEFLLPDRSGVVSAETYQTSGVSVKPVADPEMGSEAFRSQRNQFLLELTNNPVVGPKLNGYGVGQVVLEDMRLADMNQVLMPPKPDDPPPPEIIELQHKIDLAGKQLELQAHEIDLKAKDVQTRAMIADSEVERNASEVDKNKAAAALAYAQAHQAVSQPGLEAERIKTDAMMAGMKHEMDLHREHVKGDVAVKVAQAKPKSTGA